MTLKTDILKAFLENKELVKSMHDCDHGHEGSANPYHLEGSVWTHTMLVYNEANQYNKFDLIMALCHDIGKVIVRKVKDDGKVSFYGHADASIQSTIDFIYRLYSKGLLFDDEIEYFLNHAFVAMANHMIYYQNVNKLNHFSCDDQQLKNYFVKMAKIDGNGSICKSGKIKENIKELKAFYPKKWDIKLPTVTIWTGLPGSGKDYLAEKTGDEILSFDDIRLDVYRNVKLNSGWYNLNSEERYANAFEYCNENKVDLMKLISRKARKLLQKGKDISICNTSLTRKSRRSIINSIGTKYNYVIKQVFVPTEIILERNSNRDKLIPVNVINRMMDHMTVATHFEKNVNRIEYIFNIL